MQRDELAALRAGLRPAEMSARPTSDSFLARKEATMRYHHLSRDERHHIEVLVATGWTNAAVAAFLGRHPSTISRERHRNSDAALVRPYRARRASRRTRERVANVLAFSCGRPPECTEEGRSSAATPC